MKCTPNHCIHSSLLAKQGHSIQKSKMRSTLKQQQNDGDLCRIRMKMYLGQCVPCSKKHRIRQLISLSVNPAKENTRFTTLNASIRYVFNMAFILPQILSAMHFYVDFIVRLWLEESWRDKLKDDTKNNVPVYEIEDSK